MLCVSLSIYLTNSCPKTSIREHAGYVDKGALQMFEPRYLNCVTEIVWSTSMNLRL